MEIMSKKCKTHNQDFVAINKDPKCNPNERGLCLECLAKSITGNSISLMTDAEKELKDIKQEYKYQIETQANKNIGVLKELLANLIQLQAFYNQVLAKLQENINQQILLIENQLSQLDQKIEQCNVFQYYSGSNDTNNTSYNQIRILIEQQLQKLNETDLLEQCQNQLKQIDDRQISFQPDELIIEQVQDEHNTPHLNLICEDHKKVIILFDLNPQKSKENRIACVNCISGQIGLYTSLTDIKQYWNDYEQMESNLLLEKDKLINQTIEQNKSEFNNLKQKFDNKINEINKYLNETQQKRNNNVQERQLQVRRDWNKLDKSEVLFIADTLGQSKPKDNLKSSIDKQYESENEQINKFIQDSIMYLKEIANKCFEKQGQMGFVQKVQLEENKEIVKRVDINLKENQKNDIINQNQIEQHEIHKQTYNLINSDYKEKEKCLAMAFNQQNTIMIVGLFNKIGVFELKYQQFKLIQILYDHTDFVTTLFFMKKSNKFISGSYDDNIKIWAFCKRKQQIWSCQQTLEGHTDSINQVIMNNSEDLIISCSNDWSIKFWKCQTTWKCEQTLKEHFDRVYCISLNESQNKLVSCGQDQQTIIYQENQDKIWQVIQTIKGWGYRISFIGDNQIAFVPKNSKNMKIYKLNQELNQFEKSNKIKLGNGSYPCWIYFPMIFNKKKQILICRNGRRVHIIRIHNNTQFMVDQTINFKGNSVEIFGTLSDDGEYLVTWDEFTKELQLRKLDQ